MGVLLVTPPNVEPVSLDEAKRHCRIDADLDDDDGLVTSLIAAARSHVEAVTRRALITQTWRLTLDAFPAPSVSGIRFGGDASFGTRDPWVIAPWGSPGPVTPEDYTIRAPRAPLQSVASITYVDPDGATQTLGTAAYLVDTTSLPGRITRAPGTAWPTTREQAAAVSVDCVVGYGDAATAVPGGILAAIKLLIGHLYENRESVVVSTGRALVSEVPFTVDALLAPYRVLEAV